MADEIDLSMGGGGDDGLNLSFSNVSDGFQPLPEDTYDLVVISAKAKPNKKNTGQIIEFVYKVDGGEYNNRQLRDWPSLSPDALWRLRDILEAITQKPWRDDDMKLDLKDLPGRRFRGIVIQQPHYNEEKAKAGEVVNKVDTYLPAEPTEFASKTQTL